MATDGGKSGGGEKGNKGKTSSQVLHFRVLKSFVLSTWLRPSVLLLVHTLPDHTAHFRTTQHASKSLEVTYYLVRKCEFWLLPSSSFSPLHHFMASFPRDLLQRVCL